jgi:hypothetical protein
MKLQDDGSNKCSEGSPLYKAFDWGILRSVSFNECWQFNFN